MANANDYGLQSATHTYLKWSALATGTSVVKTGVGHFAGIFVSTAGATAAISVFDSTGANSTGTIISGLVPTAGTFYGFGGKTISFTNGLYVSGGTANFDIIYY